ncbi:MAG: hypothetical protein JOZ90_11590 [Alphaproteobacteria bacterium]|nr:hypothetical protein [Alphaproteobacteria bacterium]
MTTTLMLRVAAAISLFFTIGHSMGGLQKWSPNEHNPVLTAMTDMHFDMMGMSRSYLDLYLGLGWTLSIFMLLQTVLLWQMGTIARTDVAQVRPMIAAFLLATLASGIIAWRLIFPVPVLFCVALFLALAAAYWTARPTPPA